MSKSTLPNGEDTAAIAKRRDKFARLAMAVPRLPKDRLNTHQPHTPRPGQLPDRNAPTCSAPSANNKGCESYGHCRMGAIRDRNMGPVQVAIEDHRGVAVGEGRRWAAWCFIAFRQILGKNRQPEHSIAEDRVYERQIGGEYVIEQLPPYEEQGPFYDRAASAAPVADVAALRRKYIDQRKDD